MKQWPASEVLEPFYWGTERYQIGWWLRCPKCGRYSVYPVASRMLEAPRFECPPPYRVSWQETRGPHLTLSPSLVCPYCSGHYWLRDGVLSEV